MAPFTILKAMRAELVLFGAALLIVGLVASSQLLAAGSIDRYHALVGAVSHIKQTVTESHVWLEERLSGDTSINPTTHVDEPLADSAEDCHALLDGGVTDIGTLPAVSDPPTRATITELCTGIVELRAVALQRLAAESNTGAGSGLDAEFDGVFERIIALATESQAGIDRTLAGERRDLGLINAAIAAISAILLLGLVGLIRRYRLASERTRLEHAAAGAEAHAGLSSARRDGEQAEVLNRLADRVTFAKGEADLVAAATAALRRLVPSDGGDVLLLNSSQDRLMVAATWGAVEAAVGRPAKVDSPELCPGIRRGSVYALEDGADDLSVACEAHPIDSGSLLCVPMLALGKSVGVLHLRRDGTAAFDPKSQQLAGRVAEQVALGLANARLLQTMERLAMADPLTGCHNARFFDPLLDRELAAAERDGVELAVIMIDIDHFKQFNDAHGHPGGDEALKAFAKAAKAAIRESDTLARYGGEEFAVLVRRADLDGAMQVAEKIRAAVEQVVVDLGPSRTAKMTVSLGVSSTSVHGRDRMTLMRTADEALYRAKESGRNRVMAAPPPDDAPSDGDGTSIRGPRRTAA